MSGPNALAYFFHGVGGDEENEVCGFETCCDAQTLVAVLVLLVAMS
jgi:hypothetical protein